MELIVRLSTHIEMQRIRRATEEKNLELARLNEQISQNNEELRHLNEEKNEFLGIAAHDLKNPVNAIRMAARILEKEDFALAPEEVVELSGDIRLTAERMFELIQNLLDVNRIETNNIQTHIEEAQVEVIIENVAKNYRETSQRKQITIHFSAEENLPAVATDRKLIYQIADNLISNAMKFTPQERSVHISVRRLTDQDRETSELPAEAQGVLVSVKDEGPGMTPEDKAKLFTKFARLSARPTGSEHSTGLGLSIVRRLAEMVGAEVICVSEYGKGADFRIFIPQS